MRTRGWLRQFRGIALALGLLLPLRAACAAGTEAVGWEASVSVSATTVLPAEPVLVTGTLRYAGEEPFSGYASFGRAGLTYVTPSGKRIGVSIWNPPFAAAGDELPPAKAVQYQHGYSRSATLLMLYTYKGGGRGGSIFGEPGIGQLRLWAQIWEGPGLPDYLPKSVTSPPVRITVPGLPPREAAAYALWHDEQVAEMFLTGAVFLTGAAEGEARSRLERLTTDFPESVYAKYGLMALAREKQHLREMLRYRKDLSPEQAQQESHRLAAEEVALLEQVHTRYGTFHLTAMVLDDALSAACGMTGPERWRKETEFAEALLRLPNAPDEYRTRAQQALDEVRRAGPKE